MPAITIKIPLRIPNPPAKTKFKTPQAIINHPTKTRLRLIKKGKIIASTQTINMPIASPPNPPSPEPRELPMPPTTVSNREAIIPKTPPRIPNAISPPREVVETLVELLDKINPSKYVQLLTSISIWT